MTKKRKSGKPQSYPEMYADLAPRDRHRVNEKVIWAVCQLTNLDGRGRIGTRDFIEDRAKQLIIEMKRIGFQRASKHFRDAVSHRKNTAGPVPETGKVSDPLPKIPESDTRPRKRPLISMPQNRKRGGVALCEVFADVQFRKTKFHRTRFGQDNWAARQTPPPTEGRVVGVAHSRVTRKRRLATAGYQLHPTDRLSSRRAHESCGH